MMGLRRYGPLLAVGALLAGAAIAATLATPQISTVPLHVGPGSARPISGGPTPGDRVVSNLPGQVQHDFTPPQWLTTLLSALCIVLVVAAAGAVLWLALR